MLRIDKNIQSNTGCQLSYLGLGALQGRGLLHDNDGV